MSNNYIQYPPGYYTTRTSSCIYKKEDNGWFHVIWSDRNSATSNKGGYLPERFHETHEKFLILIPVDEKEVFIKLL